VVCSQARATARRNSNVSRRRIAHAQKRASLGTRLRRRTGIALIRRTLELDDVPFRIVDVQRESLAFRTVTTPGIIDSDIVRLEMRADRIDIERIDAHAQVIHVTTFAARRCTAFAPERAIDTNDIDHRSARAQLYESNGNLIAFDAATEHIAIETHEARGVARADHDVVDIADVDHGLLNAFTNAA
jgi:hypothetical protein